MYVQYVAKSIKIDFDFPIHMYILTKNKSQKLTILFRLWTNENHSYKHNEQINNPNIDNSECFGVKSVNIYHSWSPFKLCQTTWLLHKKT
jgi:hypothetical protein